MRGLKDRSAVSRGVRFGASTAVIAMLLAPATAWAQDVPSGQDPAAVQNNGTTTGGDEQIVITARRRALQAADDRKRASEAIIDSVVADEAGKLPDNSITEVLQRVAGVSIVRFAALNDPDHYSIEGSGIQVRGLSGVASRLNGRDIFSANNGRALLWGDVTPELMAAVDVYKSPTADLIEGGTGGQVDLRTKLPFDFKGGWHVAGSAEIGTGDLAKKLDYSGSVLVSNRWNTNAGDFGFLIDLAQSRLTSRDNFFRVEPYFRHQLLGQTGDYFIPGGYDYGDEGFKRDRTGIYGAVQWSPSEDLSLTATFFESRYKNHNFSHYGLQTSQDLVVDPANSTFDQNGGLVTTDALFLRDPNTFLPTGGRITSGGGTEGTRSHSTTQDISGSFDWRPGQGAFRLSGAYQHVASNARLKRLSVFRDIPYPSSFGLDLTGDLPQLTFPDMPDGYFEDPSNYQWAAAMPHEEKNRGRMDAINLDAEYTIDEGFFRSVKVGGRWANRKERDLNNGFTWTALGRGWNGDPQLTFANAAPGDVENWGFDDFFHGGMDMPPDTLWPSIDLIDHTDVDDLHHSPPAGFCGDPFASGLWFNCSPSGPLSASNYGGARSRTGHFLLPNDLGQWRTKTLAGYALVRFGHDYEDGQLGFSGNVGARVVRTRNQSLGYIVQSATTFIRNGQAVSLSDEIIPRGGSKAFTRVLPAVNLQLQPSEDVKARFAYNITMDLPTFDALRGGGTIGVATTSNPVSGQPGIFTNFTAATGNPFLKPAMSTNLDLSLEWYPKAGSMFHVAAFYKHIKDLPIFSLTQRDVTVVFSDGTTEEVTAAASDATNATKAAKVKGVEVGGRTFFDMLPGLLSGFGVEANYTYIDSKNPGDLYRDIFGTIRNDAPLQGLSKHNLNATLLYEKNRVSARFAYSWRSRYLQSTNSNGTTPTYNYVSAPGAAAVPVQIALPVYGASYGQVDAGLTFKVTDNVSLSLQGTNIFNATTRTLMGGYKNDAIYTRSWFQADRRVSLGANIAF